MIIRSDSVFDLTNGDQPGTRSLDDWNARVQSRQVRPTLPLVCALLMKRLAFWSPSRLVMVLLCLSILTGCVAAPDGRATASPAAGEGESQLTAVVARGEVASFSVSAVMPAAGAELIRSPMMMHETFNVSLSQLPHNRPVIVAYQVMPLPVNVRRAEVVRLGGALKVAQPRALLPLGSDDAFDLSRCRQPGAPRTPASPGQPLDLWLELAIPPTAPPGVYSGELRVNGVAKRVRVTVIDATLPQNPTMLVAGQMGWNSLVSLWPRAFEGVSPRLLSREDERTAPTLRVLDQLVDLAAAHHVQLSVPEMMPTVKWPAGTPEPEIDWSDFDSVVLKWLEGETPKISRWPLPEPPDLPQYGVPSRTQYWRRAAVHADQLGLLARMPSVIAPRDDGADAALRLSDEAALRLDAHPRLGVEMPLERSKLLLVGQSPLGRVQPRDAGRLTLADPPLIYVQQESNWPVGVPEPGGIITGNDRPVLNAADAQVPLWLGFLRRARVIDVGPVLPADAKPLTWQDPGQVVWFYPGEWFGLSEPVPSTQLKWFAQALQRAELLRIVAERGQRIDALVIAQLLLRPVALEPRQSKEQDYQLLAGTAERQTWNEGFALIQRIAQLYEQDGTQPSTEAQQQLRIEILRWMVPLEQPLMMPRRIDWLPSDGGINARIELDFYNASGAVPEGSRLEISVAELQQLVPNVRRLALAALPPYAIRPVAFAARADLERAVPGIHPSLELMFFHGLTNRGTPMRMMAPLSRINRLPVAPVLDGSLEDWAPGDAVQTGPLVRMLSRPAVQQHEMPMGKDNVAVWAGESEKGPALAFRVQSGEEPAGTRRNFVAFDAGRAWGENVVEMFFQPVYADGSVGPLLYVACKPNGVAWSERRLDPRLNVTPWQPFESNTRYAATLDDQRVWRGELSIPWSAILAERSGERPVLLRFNFAQHRPDLLESATWAGPVDRSRDERITGCLLLP